MTYEETVRLVAYVASACPAMRLEQTTPRAWHDLLDDVPYADAQVAVKRVLRRERYVGPTDIRQEVSSMRADRVDRDEYEVPAADPDDPQRYVAALRAGQMRSADGLKPRDMSAIAGTFRRPPPPQCAHGRPARSCLPCLRGPEPSRAEKVSESVGGEQ